MKYDIGELIDRYKLANVPPTTFDKNVALKTNPHYTDTRFNTAQTVYSKRSNEYGHKHLEYVYSDRLIQWDYEKARDATKVANESGATPRSCQWYENYLSAYLGVEITIEHILAGVNVSNGFPYFVLGYREK